MNRLLLFCFIAFVSVKADKEDEPDCDGIYVHNKFHRKEILGTGLNRPYQLSYDQSDNRVYFSNNIGKEEEDSFEIGYVRNGKHEIIKSVENGFATAIDNKNKILYIGGSNGIFKKDLAKNNSEVEKVIGKHNVWDMFYKDHLYFIAYPSQHLYKVIYKDKKHVAEREHKFVERIFQFAIDGKDDKYITDENGLFKLNKNATEKKAFEGDAPKHFRALEINNKGHAYVAGQNAIYYPHENYTLEKIASIKNIFGITFDTNNNIIYSDPTQIVRLLPEEC